MDPEMQKKIDEAIAKALGRITSEIAEIRTSVGQNAEAVKKIGAIEENVRVLGDTIAKLPPANPETIKKLVGETITEQQQATTAAAARVKAKNDWLEKNAPKLPPIYRNQIPESDNAQEIEAAGKAAVEQYTKDFAARGGAAAGEGGGAPPAERGSGGGFLKMPGQAQP